MDDVAPEKRLCCHLDRMDVPLGGRAYEGLGAPNHVLKCCWRAIATTQRHAHSSSITSTIPMRLGCSIAHRAPCGHICHASSSFVLLAKSLLLPKEVWHCAGIAGLVKEHLGHNTPGPLISLECGT